MVVGPTASCIPEPLRVTQVLDSRFSHVIPRGSWGDVARRFTMIRWAGPEFASRLPSSLYTPPPPPPCAAAASSRGIRSGPFDEENPFVQNLSVLLVQADEGISALVVDRIGYFYRNLPRRADVIVTTVGARHKCQQESRRKRNRSSGWNRRPSLSSRDGAPLLAGTHTLPCATCRARHDEWPRAGHETCAAAPSDGRPESRAGRTFLVCWPTLVRRARARDGGAGRRCARGVAFRAMVRALPPRFFRGGGAAVVGRRSAATPASFRRCLVSERSNAIVGAVTTGYECLPSSCDGLTGPDDHGPMISTG
ncbi:MLO-like protein 4 [Dorcoceras hygrometricum]|uniref:MLO-like protein 4 n=1 Tax=Dorcoceras hygrometricum TaxID=472368 RepID=A0A2Z7CZ51_9LAMI|nr:MLO-like protein 4 [Dorcoceras hygrometricum]